MYNLGYMSSRQQILDVDKSIISPYYENLFIFLITHIIYKTIELLYKERKLISPLDIINKSFRLYDLYNTMDESIFPTGLDDTNTGKKIEIQVFDKGFKHYMIEISVVIYYYILVGFFGFLAFVFYLTSIRRIL